MHALDWPARVYAEGYRFVSSYDDDIDEHECMEGHHFCKLVSRVVALG